MTSLTITTNQGVKIQFPELESKHVKEAIQDALKRPDCEFNICGISIDSLVNASYSETPIKLTPRDQLLAEFSEKTGYTRIKLYEFFEEAFRKVSAGEVFNWNDDNNNSTLLLKGLRSTEAGLQKFEFWNKTTKIATVEKFL